MKDFHAFPNGFNIQLDSKFEYVKSLRGIKNKEELIALLREYQYLFPEFINVLKNIDHVNFNELVKSFDNPQIQENSNELILEILVPRTSLPYVIIMEHFKVPFGVSVLQTWNAKLISETNGFWFHSKVVC